MRARLDRFLPQLVLAPSCLLALVFVYGFLIWTVLLSFTDSRMLPSFRSWVGWHQYIRLWSDARWRVAVGNCAVFSLWFVGGALAIGLFLAILLDREIRAEGLLRTIYLHPMALSSIVAGAAWQWILNPESGIEKTVRSWGWSGFRFDWLVNPKMAIYAVVLGEIWKSSGFAMLLLLAGLRSMDRNLVRAAAVDGASEWRMYQRVLLPALRPVFMSVFVVLLQRAIVTFDLVVALTSGGPGYSSDMPALYMIEHAFQRNELALGAASAAMMLFAVGVILMPYFTAELRRQADA